MQSCEIPPTKSVNIIVFGERDAGTRSVINLIAGRPVANFSPDVHGFIMSSKQYLFDVTGRHFRIWDTVSLEEPEMEVIGYLMAIKKAHELIQQLSKEGGVDLLLFCIRGSRFTATIQSNYRLFYEVLCRSAVPISLVITHLEREPDMDDWWPRNSKSLEKYGIMGAGHACVTGLPDHSKYEESKIAIQNLLVSYDGKGKYSMPSDAWFMEFMRLFGLWAPPKALKRKSLMNFLTKHCGMDPKVAQDIAEKLCWMP
ncbi:hypothetical protein BU15DRAFT_55036 [Melanogaster broomeanus]|nr:hypothetical protein BU15DRAFT_55036 [Melanogaster broomeanus]